MTVVPRMMSKQDRRALCWISWGQAWCRDGDVFIPNSSQDVQAASFCAKAAAEKDVVQYLAEDVGNVCCLWTSISGFFKKEKNDYSTAPTRTRGTKQRDQY
ncbi:hypothetical protein J3459_002412 [Metarhizium acridum]|uniref:uncharacterized protein n=1 Tax=Metarhizium acridum TaxID=92637 RepID=UPI001C6CBE16|nr:hypothetical protein J3458_001392 [Metarhizium acridum]KAG8428781.1 hypothetical protein J3459_002412 [Metarhizium acridum]